MRVPTRSISDNAISQLQKLTSQQALLQKQVSTNQRIFLPSDDPAAMNRLLAIDNEQRQIKQYQTNIGTASDLAKASYAGLKGLGDISTRAGELATLGNGVISADSAKAYASEVNQLIEQATQLANTRFGSDYIYGGTATDAPPFTVTRDADGNITAAAYAGNANTSSIALSDTTSISARTSGATNSGLSDFINQLTALRDALNANDKTAIAAASTGLEAGGDTITNAVSQNGALQLRIELATTQQKARSDSLEQLASGEADIDLPSTVVKLSQATTSYEAALASASKIMNLSLLDYMR